MATHSIPLDAFGPAPLPSDQRAFQRVPMLGEMQGEIMVYQPMQVTEVSCSGATVETRVGLQLDSVHDVRLALGRTSFMVKARVVHSRISDISQDLVTYRAGLEFVNASPAVLAAIAEFLDGVEAGRRGSIT
jgi:hypothetical protein